MILQEHRVILVVGVAGCQHGLAFVAVLLPEIPEKLDHVRAIATAGTGELGDQNPFAEIQIRRIRVGWKSRNVDRRRHCHQADFVAELGFVAHPERVASRCGGLEEKIRNLDRNVLLVLVDPVDADSIIVGDLLVSEFHDETGSAFAVCDNDGFVKREGEFSCRFWSAIRIRDVVIPSGKAAGADSQTDEQGCQKF